jgi:hypothetical protein
MHSAIDFGRNISFQFIAFRISLGIVNWIIERMRVWRFLNGVANDGRKFHESPFQKFPRTLQLPK